MIGMSRCGFRGLALWMVVLPWAAGVHLVERDPSPYMAKVVLMLQEMQANSQKLKQQADQQQQEVAAACTSNMATADSEVQKLALQVQLGKAAVETLTTDIQQLNFDITQYNLDWERDQQDIALAHQEHDGIALAFQRDLATYEAAIGAAERAQLMLQAQMPTARPPQLLQAVAELRAAVEQLPRAGRNLRHGAAFLQVGEEYTPDSGGMTKDEHLFDDFDSVAQSTNALAGKANTLEGQIGQIITLFRQLKDNLIKQSAATKTDFQETVGSLEQQCETNRATIATNKETLAQKKTDLATKTKELADAVKSSAAAKTYRAELKKACDEAAADYKVMNKMREGEIFTLGQAVELLKAAADEPAGEPALAAALLRRGTRVYRSAGDDAGEAKKVLGFLRVQASKLASVSLGHLAGEVEALIDSGMAAVEAVRAAGETVGPEAREDAMNKVKDLIQNLITKLLAEAAAEASHNSWCESELKKNEMALKTSKADIETQSALKDKLQADLSKLKLELVALNATIARQATERAAAVQERNESRATNLETIAEAKQCSEAVGAALTMIKDYYKDASKKTASLVKRTAVVSHKQVQKANASHVQKANASHDQLAETKRELPEQVTREAVSGPQVEEGQGVVAMLEVVRDGYVELGQKTTQMEEKAQQDHVEELRAHDVLAVSTSSDRDFKLQQQQQMTTALKDSETNLAAATQANKDAQTVYEELKPPCLNKETFEEKAAKRQQEIDALQEAYTMLEQYSKDMGYALLQGVPRAATALTAPAKVALAKAATAAPAAAAPHQALALPVAAAAAPAAAAAAKHLVAVARGRARVVAKATSGADDVTQDVVVLLQGIQTEVKEDLAADQKVYENNTAWCQKTITESQAAITSYDEQDRNLMTDVEVSTQSMASLEVELARLKSDLAKQHESMKNAEGMREKAAADFHENEKELLEATLALTHALEVLQSRYENVDDGRDFAAERQAIAAKKPDSAAGSAPAEPVLQPAAASLVGVADEVQRALTALPPEEAELVNSFMISSALQDFYTQPTHLFPDAAAAPSAAHRGGWHRGLALTVSKVSASPEGQQIFGILKGLLDKFKADLTAAQAQEAQDKQSHDGLKTAKNAEVTALQNTIALKETQYAQDSTKYAESKEALVGVRESRKAEFEHLLGVQEYCRQVEAEYQKRKKGREEELASLGEAIVILDGDSAAGGAAAGGQGAEPMLGDGAEPMLGFHAINTGAVALHAALAASAGAFHVAPPTARPGTAPATPKPQPESIVDQYLKLHAGAAPKLRSESSAAQALRARRAPPLSRALAALRLRPPQPVAPVMLSRTAGRKVLDALALHSSVRQQQPSQTEGIVNGAFDQVGAALDKIAQTLKDEKKREVEFHDRCTDEKFEAEAQLARRQHDLSALDSNVQRLGSIALEQDTQISGVNKQIEELTTSLTEAKTARTTDTASYERTIAQEEANQDKLNRAIQKLSALYGTAFLVEKRQDPRPAGAPGGFSKPAEKHEGGHGVVSILELLVEDSEENVKSMRASEQEARDAFGGNVASSNAAITQKKDAITMMSTTKTNAVSEGLQKTAEHTAVKTEITEITKFLVIVKDKCGYILENFVKSQTARQGQIDNVRQAKEAILGAIA